MQSKSFRIAVFADGEVGKSTLDFLISHYPDDVFAIVCTSKETVLYNNLIANHSSIKIYANDDLKDEIIYQDFIDLKLDYILLAWWPFIIKKPIIDLAAIGVLNFHPSFLPFNRGKHYNFWSIVEESPFGVTIHFVDESIDSGDIIFQSRIEKSWLDSGETLYYKAQEEMLKLFYYSYPKIRKKEYVRIKQDQGKGSFHLAKEIDKASFIEIDKMYSARDLLNLLRARTFSPHPAAWFEDNGEKFEVRIKITKK